MKQTAVEWLISQILVEFESYHNDEGELIDKPTKKFYNAYIDSFDLSEFVEQAKEMEKEQIKEAHTHNRCINNQTFDCTIESLNNAEQYYNETFNQKEK